MTTLEDLVATAQQLANDLSRYDDGSPCACRGDGNLNCLAKEEQRPLARAEKAKEWQRRPFWAYDTNRMCNGCLAYFHAERAAQVLQEMFWWQKRNEAIEARKTATATAKLLVEVQS